MLTLIVLSSDWGAFRQREEQTQKQNQASAGLGEHYAEYTNLGRDKIAAMRDVYTKRWQRKSHGRAPVLGAFYSPALSVSFSEATEACPSLALTGTVVEVTADSSIPKVRLDNGKEHQSLESLGGERSEAACMIEYT